MSKYRYDYYEIHVPADLEQRSESDEREHIKTLSDYAIDEARERATLFATHCEWESRFERRAFSDQIGMDAYMFRVRRRRIVS